ncbi:transcriptional regulator domain-containing protein [Bradyrhizobium elkanii]|uniref:Transcriptional regulator-like domain-containing protein n=1 Tax=Bradyrhizobium elkanii TaxID=29448 RepID=A0A8I1YDU0_BRAEL|nr:DUF6499 domain-containing protein [Bradyrhizobium elkanii]MBP1299824.1 hypothetical protein [Bradyrhizobium elkanii]
MAVADWRSEQAYPDAKNAEAADIAWEWLRRNREYQKDYRIFVRNGRSGEMAELFRRKWGLSFRS